MIRTFFLSLMLGAALNAAAQSADPALDALNRAGEQRMLSQRIAKSYIQIGLNVLPLAAKQELDDAVARFEANMRVLEGTISSDVTRDSLNRLRKAWGPFRQSARGAPRRESAIWLAHQADEVLAAAEVHTRNLQSATQSAAGYLVALSGRQRMLSQRIAKSYLLISWGDGSDLTREELDTAVAEFSRALVSLGQRSENTAAIQRELEEMGQQWEWLQSALASDGASSYRLIVAEAAEAILGVADRVARLYENLPR